MVLLMLMSPFLNSVVTPKKPVPRHLAREPLAQQVDLHGTLQRALLRPVVVGDFLDVFGHPAADDRFLQQSQPGDDQADSGAGDDLMAQDHAASPSPNLLRTAVT